MNSDETPDEPPRHLPRLWMVKRVPVEKFQINPKLELPESSVRTFTSMFQGSADHKVQLLAFDLLRMICDRKLRLACSCTADGHLRPEIMCRARRGGCSFSLAKMPSSPKRPEHLPSCPFSRNVKLTVDNVRRADRSVFGFSGNFALPISRGLPADPAEVSSRPTQAQTALPKLMRMFAALLGEAGFSHLVAKDRGAEEDDLYGQFDRLLRAAKTFNVAANLPLQRVFSKSLYDREVRAFKRRVEMRFESVDPDKPRIGFLALYTTQAEQRVLRGPSGEIEVASNVLFLPGTTEADYFKSPALALICYGAPKAGSELRPLTASIFPVYSGHCFTPLANDMARSVLKVLLAMRERLQTSHPHLAMDIEVPLERVVIGLPDVPDFKVNAVNKSTGEIRTVYALLDDKRHRRQIGARETKVTDWRNSAGRAVFVIDGDQLAKPEDLQGAIASCLVC